MVWKGKLDKDAVNRGVIVESSDLLEELDFADILGQCLQAAFNVGLRVFLSVELSVRCEGNPTSSAAFNFMRTYVPGWVSILHILYTRQYFLLESDRSPTA